MFNLPLLFFKKSFMPAKIIIILFLCLFIAELSALGQDKGQFGGDFQINTKYYDRDSLRSAAGTPFYDYLKYGANAWFNFNYSIKGFTVGLRLDGFLNSDLYDTNRAFSEIGIGRLYATKKIDKLTLTVGHIYEQYATGTTFRAYEARGVGIDQAMVGVSLQYDFSNNLRASAFTGRLKDRFGFYKPIIKGLNIDGNVKLSDKISLHPGFSTSSRTIDNEEMSSIVGEVNTYALEDRFNPKYNTYLGSIYNTLSAGNFSWYLELAGKTEDVLRDANGVLVNPENGYVVYNTLTYSQKGLGIVLQGKYTKDYEFRAHPNAVGIFGNVNYLPSMTRQNTYRLLSRYNAAIQPLAEFALQADFIYTPKKGITLHGNYSDIRRDTKAWSSDAPKEDLYWREYYLDVELKLRKKKWKLLTGLQMLDYNQHQFEFKGDFVNTFTPFTEFVYKFDRKKSLRIEFQYMMTERKRKFGRDLPAKTQDRGDWAFALAEFSIAPNWSFTLANMLNIGDGTDTYPAIHYPTILVTYSKDASRFALSYVKQPDGIVCTGGVCRYEAAFSGVKFDVTTSF